MTSSRSLEEFVPLPRVGHERSPAGRDARLPRWLTRGDGTSERPSFDSVVIRGNGVGALVCAARLARSASLKDRVRIAAPRPTEDRRLVNGCTLRARSLDYYAAALGAPRAALVEALFGDRAEVAETWAQRVCLTHEGSTGRFSLGPVTRWMGVDERSEKILAYSLRNGHLVGRLAEWVSALGVHFDDDVPETFDECLRRAHGDRPLVVNATHVPVSDLPKGPKPRRFVVASQLTLRRRDDAPLPPHSSMVAIRRRERAFDTGVFYPFVDPLTPDSDYYGIFYRVEQPGETFSKADAIEKLRFAVEGVADALGLDTIDAEQTRGEAMVPCNGWHDVLSSRSDWLDLHRTYSACTPIITGDGMARAGLAGWVAAESILAGEDPVSATNLSLQRWRRVNRGFDQVLTSLSWLGEPIVRHAPGLFQYVADKPDMWAGVE